MKVKVELKSQVFEHRYLPIVSTMTQLKGGKWTIYYSTKSFDYKSNFPTKSVAIKVIKNHGFLTD